MPDILHRVGIDATPDRVFSALTTLDGLRAWWTDCDGAPLDGVVDFRFCEMQVDAAPELVHWRCTRGPAEWVGTEVSFRLVFRDDQTFVLFSHAGWREPVEFMHHCSTKWGVFLLSLRDVVEGREGRPHGRDIKIHVRD